MHNLKKDKKQHKETPTHMTCASERFLRIAHLPLHTVGLFVRRRAFMFALAIVPIGSVGSLATSDFSPQQSLIAENAVHTKTESILTTTEAVTFTFAMPHNNTDHLTVSVSPHTEIITTWNDNYTELTVRPQTAWQPHTTYKIALTPHMTDTQPPSLFYVFHTTTLPIIIKSIPQQDAQNATLVNNRDIRIFFDRSVHAYDIIPKVLGYGVVAQTYDTEHKILTITLPHSLTQKKELHISLHARHKDALHEPLLPIGALTLNVMPQTPSQWPDSLPERLTIASQSVQPYVTEGKYIDINLAAHITTLFEDGDIVTQFVNSPGAAETPTPPGVYRIENKAHKPISAMFGVALPYWMAFTPDGKYGFHDLIEWPQNHPDFPDSPQGGKESLANIDKAVSPGCVRHNSTDSQILYAWAEIGTPVKIY